MFTWVANLGFVLWKLNDNLENKLRVQMERTIMPSWTGPSSDALERPRSPLQMHPCGGDQKQKQLTSDDKSMTKYSSAIRYFLTALQLKLLSVPFEPLLLVKTYGWGSTFNVLDPQYAFEVPTDCSKTRKEVIRGGSNKIWPDTDVNACFYLKALRRVLIMV